MDYLCKLLYEEIVGIYDRINENSLDKLEFTLKPDMVGNRGIRPIYNHMVNIVNKVQNVEFLRLVECFSVLKHLDGHNKTLIVLGPNGSGKSSFANYMKTLDTHVKVIPASKPIKTHGLVQQLYDSTIEKYNQQLYSNGGEDTNLLNKLIIGICSEHADLAMKFYDTKKANGKSTYEKVKEIFDDFFEVKLDYSQFSQKQMMCKKGDGAPYTFNQMSDGERVAFFYIATVLSAPEQSFIIVDEPENHLNPAIYNKIWDRLIEVRSDCQFIFISHTIDFISARTNYELMRISEFEYPSNFKFEFLGESIENIPNQMIVDLVGSRKPVLFCEGSKVDFDYKIYEALFGEKYTIIPTGNCTTVKDCVTACGLHARKLSIPAAIGIIDSDLKTSTEMDTLKNKGIYTLKCNEIEMLMLDEVVFKAVLERRFKSASVFDEFKGEFFEKTRSEKERIVKRLVKAEIDGIITRTTIDDKANKTKEDFQNNLSAIYNSIDVDFLWSNYEGKIDAIVDGGDYTDALRICCLEHREIMPGLTNKFVSDYSDTALGIIRTDKNVQEQVKQKYFPDIT
ncbi:AAA family ATPase [Butyrivibrio sp. INlla14]|uniref:AAA family ATPase n=1 Tax=Butyrivibrio sp. INlla14 TaxID=1520808 RepID=UPI000876B58D|nr:AAA family ATPase [Butyrivibrio sp. INlla14]SCY77016.1 Protein of unknown function [Butyrivibrio sp. INlla14]